MGYRVDISDLANNDIDGTLTWIKYRSVSAASRWFNSLLAAIQSLEKMPGRCPIAPETRSFVIEIRHLIFGSRTLQHRIIFGISIDEQTEENVVTIYRIRNSSQHPLSDSQIFGEYDEE